MQELRDKSAIVTGGAVRLGRALASRLADEGVDVCLHYSGSREAAEHAVAEFRQRGVRAVSVQADFRDPVAAAARVVESAAAAFGRIDILVNNAAIFEAGQLADTDEAHWDRHLDINLKAPAFLCREFAARLQPEQSAQIVNIVDWRACRPAVGHLAYTVAKSGLVALTQILAQELAPRVRVNAIAPGVILPPAGATEAQFHALVAGVPLGRAGRPDDVADALLYLLRSDYVTGEILQVTGGRELGTGRGDRVL